MVGTTRQLGLHQSFTVMVWVKIDHFNVANQGDNCILGQDTTAERNCLHLLVRERKPYMGFYAEDVGSNETLTAGCWHHLAFVYSFEAESQTIYLDGHLSATASPRRPLQGDGLVHLSQYARSRGLNGSMSSLRIFRRAIPREEIAQSMFVALPTGLVWAEGAHGRLADRTPHQLTGRLEPDSSLPMTKIFFPVINPLQLDAVGEFSKLFNSSLVSDLTITCDDLTLPVHRAVLLVRSDYFLGMFESSMAESDSRVLDLSSWEPRALREFFRLLYTLQPCPVAAADVSLMMVVLSMAHYFQSRAVTALAEHAIMTALANAQDTDESTVHDLTAFAEENDAQKLLAFLLGVSFPRYAWLEVHPQS